MTEHKRKGPGRQMGDTGREMMQLELKEIGESFYTAVDYKTAHRYASHKGFSIKTQTLDVVEKDENDKKIAVEITKVTILGKKQPTQ